MPSNPKNTRRCIICRSHKDKSELIRLVVLNESVVIDADNKIEGRGYYICRDNECLKKVVSKKILGQIIKKSVDDNLYEELKKYYEQN